MVAITSTKDNSTKSHLCHERVDVTNAFADVVWVASFARAAMHCATVAFELVVIDKRQSTSIAG